MKTGRNTAIEITLAALALGIAGDSLLRTMPWGVNVPAMIGLSAAALVVLRRRSGAGDFSVTEMGLLGSALFFSLWFAIRDSMPLLILNFLAILLVGVTLFVPVIRLKVREAGVVHYIFSFVAAGLSAAFLPFILLSKDLRNSEIAKGELSKKVLLGVRGALIAAPLILVFGALFAMADAGFENLLIRTFDVVPSDVALHGLFIALFSWPAAGLLRALTLGVSPGGKGEGPAVDESPVDEECSESSAGGSSGEETDNARAEFGNRHIPSITEPDPSEAADEVPLPSFILKPARSWNWKDLNNSILPEFLTLGQVEVGVILGSLNLLFLTFVLFQLPYLFGGMDLIQNQPGLKLADYARRGFGELFFASTLVLPVLLTLHWLIKSGSVRAQNLFRYLAAIQIGLLFVIMASAFQRLLLLTGKLGYGMTEGRFYPMAFIIWLAVVFLLFGFTVLRGERGKFAFRTAVSALVLVAVLNVLNPDDYIVRTNLALTREGRPFDVSYNSFLSTDASAALLEALPELNDVDKDTVMRNRVRLQCRYSNAPDPRSWNYSRWSSGELPQIRDYIGPVGCKKIIEWRAAQ